MTDHDSPSLALDDTAIQDAELVERSIQLSLRQLSPPGIVPGYQIDRCLGEGAYGSVWLAREQNTGKQVAIKFYTHRGGVDWPLLSREVEKLAVLYTCRDIVRLLEVGWDAAPPYYVMEYLENGSLVSLLQDGPLPPQEATRIASVILRALVHAHGSGILHCDLKPANVLLDKNLQPRLADFGQSRLSNEQDPALGTLFYMAPEQADLAAIPDARWDVYALGALLYQCLCGHPPHKSEANEQKILSTSSLRERLAIYRRILQTSERPSEHSKTPGVDKRLTEIVDRCLETDPQKRFANAQAVLDAIELRDRQRARRPVVALGIIAPLLLLLMLVPLGLRGMEKTVETAENEMILQASQRSTLMAVAVAGSIENELAYRVEQLQEAAGYPDLAELLEKEAHLPVLERTQLPSLLKKWRVDYGISPTLDPGGIANPSQFHDQSWFIVNLNGKQIWRVGSLNTGDQAPAPTIDKYWYWRDYFHWNGEDYPWIKNLPHDDPKNIQREDIQTAWDKTFHISIPFQSQATGVYIFAISVPIWNKEKTEIVGILARTIFLGEFLSMYKRYLGPGMGANTRVEITGEATDEIVRFVALIDGRNGKILDHPWMTEQQLKRLQEETETFEELNLDDELRECLQRLRSSWEAGADISAEAVEENYSDPISRINEQTYASYGEQWLAAFWPVAGTHWWTTVQERHKKAIDPVEKIDSQLRYFGGVGLLVFCSLIAVLWYFLLRGVNNPISRLGAASSSRDFRVKVPDTELLSDSQRNSDLA